MGPEDGALVVLTTGALFPSVHRAQAVTIASAALAMWHWTLELQAVVATTALQMPHPFVNTRQLQRNVLTKQQQQRHQQRRQQQISNANM